MARLTSELIISLIDRVTGPSRAVTAAVATMQSRIQRNNAALASARGGMLEAAAVGYVLARAISAPVRSGLAFESMLEDIGQKANIAGTALDAVGASVRKVGLATGQGATETGKAIDFLAGMGLDPDAAVKAAEPIGRAATAYRAVGEELAAATFAVVDNLKVPVEEAEYALDIMAAAGKEGGFELRDMAKEFPAITAAAQALGIKGTAGVGDLTAALEVARKGAGSGAEAATNLQNFLAKIVSKETLTNFKKFGVDVPKELAKAAEGGISPIEHMLGVIDEITEGGRPEKLAQLFADMQVNQFIRPMLANMDEYRRIRAAALAAAGTVEEDFQRRMKTGAGATMRFNAQMENLNNIIGATLIPAMVEMIDLLAPVIESVAQWAEANPELTATIIGLTAALVALRVAGIAAQFAFWWMRGAYLAAAVGGLRAVGTAMWAATAAMLPLGRAARAARAAMVGFAAAASITGAAGALRIAAASMGAALLGLLNPIRLVRGALVGLRLAVMLALGPVSLAIAGIAAAGAFVYANWSGLKEMFGGIASVLSERFPAAAQAVSDAFTWLGEVLSNFKLSLSGEEWAALGQRIGTSIADSVASVAQVARDIVAAFASIPGEIIALFTGLGDRIVAAIGSIVPTINWPELPGWVSRLIGGEQPPVVIPVEWSVAPFPAALTAPLGENRTTSVGETGSRTPKILPSDSFAPQNVPPTKPTLSPRQRSRAPIDQRSDIGGTDGVDTLEGGGSLDTLRGRATSAISAVSARMAEVAAAANTSGWSAWDWAQMKDFQPRQPDESFVGFNARLIPQALASSLISAVEAVGPSKFAYPISGMRMLDAGRAVDPAPPPLSPRDALSGDDELMRILEGARKAPLAPVAPAAAEAPAAPVAPAVPVSAPVVTQPSVAPIAGSFDQFKADAAAATAEVSAALDAVAAKADIDGTVTLDVPQPVAAEAAPPPPVPLPDASRFDGAFDQFRTEGEGAANTVGAKLDEVASKANITGSVNMNDAALDATLAKAQRLLATLQQVGSAAVSATGAVGRLGEAVSRQISDSAARQVRATYGDVA